MLHLNLALPDTCYIGQILIYECFLIKDVTPLEGAYLTKGARIGDHIVMFLEIPIRKIMGGTQSKIERPEVI